MWGNDQAGDVAKLLDVAVGADTNGFVDAKLWQGEVIGGAPGTHNLHKDKDNMCNND